MQATLRSAFTGTTFKTARVAAPQQSSSQATRQVTCMAKKKVGTSCFCCPHHALPLPGRCQGSETHAR